ncbi:MAG: hypothetical protein KDB72_02920 [Mycobacterium sp.]|nr:hypothetical protein [Mycobacterium sp.]
MAEVAVTENTKKRRVENRQRTRQVKFRLLPQEEEKLRLAVEQSGHPTIQAFLLAKLPEIVAS